MPNAKITGNVVGAAIQKARLAAGINQVDLAAELSVSYDIDVTQNLISKIESGRRPVRDKELAAICKILNVAPNTIFGWR